MEMGVVRAALPRKLPPGERRPAPPKVIGPISYRMITGGFQINIPVRADDGVLTFDEEYLSIFKRRLSVMAPYRPLGPDSPTLSQVSLRPY